MARKRYRMVCSYCGSEDVLADAYAFWNVKAQRWEVNNTFDKGSHCDTCEGECRIEEKEIVKTVKPRGKRLSNVTGKNARSLGKSRS